MPKPLEVRATTSFGVFRQNGVYEIDIEDDRMLSLLGVGYLEPTSDLEDDDAGLDRGPGLDVGSFHGGSAVHRDGLVGSSEAERVADVRDRAEPGDDTAHGASARVRGRKASGIEDSGRGADTGAVGDA